MIICHPLSEFSSLATIFPGQDLLFFPMVKSPHLLSQGPPEHTARPGAQAEEQAAHKVSAADLEELSSGTAQPQNPGLIQHFAAQVS